MPPTAVHATRIRLPRDPARGARPLPIPADPSAEFADHVRAALDGPVLRYSQRLQLLKDAHRRGIGRFEANLVIASVLHRSGMAQEYELRPTKAEWLAPLLTAAVLQTAILAGAWWVLQGA